MTFYVEDETGRSVPGTDVPGTPVPGTDVPETNIPGTKVPGTNVPGTNVPWDAAQTAWAVCEAVLKEEGCPWEAQVSLVITDNEGIREINRKMRGIDRETDVLSFPNLDFARPGEFFIDEARRADYFDPDSGEVILGDIMISAQMVQSQAEKYGHSPLREFAFLVAHSMFHLCGYDHMEEQDAQVMERKQEEILESLGLRR